MQRVRKSPLKVEKDRDWLSLEVFGLKPGFEDHKKAKRSRE